MHAHLQNPDHDRISSASRIHFFILVSLSIQRTLISSMQDSKNESPPSTLSTAITIQNQHGDLDDSQERNEDKLNEMCQRLLSLLDKNNMDEALAVAKKMALLDCQSSMSDTCIRLMYKYQQLVDKAEASAASMALLAQSTKKIDFISTLPYDLVVYTVYYLWCTVTSLDHTPPFLYVSKTWRRIILEATPFFSRHATESSAKTLQSRIRRMTIDSRVVSLSSMLGHQLVSVKYLSIGKFIRLFIIPVLIQLMHRFDLCKFVMSHFLWIKSTRHMLF